MVQDVAHHRLLGEGRKAWRDCVAQRVGALPAAHAVAEEWPH
jgi:hypothetical protein